jgi:hypothetical protein
MQILLHTAPEYQFNLVSAVVLKNIWKVYYG